MTAEDRAISNGDAKNGDRNGGNFGLFLKSQREARGISLQQVAGRTNIQPEILVHIETERLDQLPEPVYIKGFVRAYAEAIGVDPREAVLRYERHDAAYRQALSARQLRGRRRFMRRMLLAIVLGGGLILIVTALLHRSPEQPSNPVASETAEKRSPSEAQTASETAPATADPGKQKTGAVAENGAAKKAVNKQPLMLSAVGLKETTLKIIVDGKRPKVYHLKADTRLEIEAQREFNILVDDARAVTLYLDGQPVVVPGREGQQVTLQLP